MIPIYTVEEAEKTILLRKSILDITISDNLKQSIKSIFGKYLEPQLVVKEILDDIKERDDQAIYDWTKKIDKYIYQNDFEITDNDLDLSIKKISQETKNSLLLSIERVFNFHKAQPISNWSTSDLGGKLGQIISPIKSIGVYVPGGTAPLPSTVVHSIIPAIVAGVEDIVIVSPPKIKDIIKATVGLIKRNFQNIRLFQIGGAQAIGALAFGTQSVPKVNKIVGPGNLFVTLAKREVYGLVGIDGIAGPTEAMIIADKSASPSLIASDLLAQAEHDFLAIPILITNDNKLANEVQLEVDIQIEKLSRKNIARKSIQTNGGIVVVDNLEIGFDLVNKFAPEHLSILTRDPWKNLDSVKNSGGIFLGENSCEVLGDYIAGPSHVMPTGGSAHFNSPLNVHDFIKFISVVGLDKKTVQKLAPSAEIIAREEELTAHAEAARRRYND